MCLAPGRGYESRASDSAPKAFLEARANMSSIEFCPLNASLHKEGLVAVDRRAQAER